MYQVRRIDLAAAGARADCLGIDSVEYDDEFVAWLHYLSAVRDAEVALSMAAGGIGIDLRAGADLLEQTWLVADAGELSITTKAPTDSH